MPFAADRPSVLIFIAPADQSGGVGDYAEHVLAELGGMFDEVHEIRTLGPGEDGMGDIRRHRQHLRAIERRYGRQNVVVHAELSSGSTGPFWILRASRAAHRSAVVHDAPLPVWWPWRVREVVQIIQRHWEIESWFGRLERWIFGRALRRLEARTLAGVVTVALSDTGAARISEFLGGAEVVRARHYIPAVPEADIVPLADRPLAVGLFGHVYGGKGFELLSRLRVELPDEIEVRIAGRGTHALERMRGVTIVGAVDGDSERDFFNSIRVLVLPYNRMVGRDPVYPASGAAARAFSFHTPVVSSRSGTFDEAALEGGMVAADDIEGIAAEVVRIFGDPVALEELERETAGLASTRTIRGSLQPLVEIWSEWISETTSR